MSKLNNVYKQLFIDKNGRFVVAQFPNVPLIIWLVSILVNLVINNHTANTIISAVGTVSLATWAILELFSGVNLFRKILGTLVLVYIAFSLSKLLF